MPNKFLDQERAELLKGKVAASTTRQFLPAWPRHDKDLPAVDLDVDWVRFSVTNHRTRAEQEKVRKEPGHESLFSQDPLGDSAQQAQYEILASQERFEELRQDLKNRRQQEPAIVTPEGVLVNGNRRAAALRSLLHDDAHLDSRYIRCLVLPDDANPDEIVLLETELQVAKDYKEQYSWINEAMLIEELYEKNGRDFARVAQIMRRKAQDLQGEFEKLQQVHQLVALSRGTRSHIDFEPNQSAFEELAKHIRNKPESEKQSVRSVYFLGALTDVNYRDLRHLRLSDADLRVEAELIDDPALSGLVGAANGPSNSPEVSVLDDALGDKPKVSVIEGILRLLAAKGTDDEIALGGGNDIPAQVALAHVRQSIEKAAEEAHEEEKDEAAVTIPLHRLERARKELDRAKGKLTSARSYEAWNELEFQAKLAELRDLIAGMGIETQ